MQVSDKKILKKLDSIFSVMNIPKLPLGKNAIISGSTIWHVLTHGDGWFPNDLDIFCTHSEIQKLRKVLVDNDFKLFGCTEKKYTEDACKIVEEWCRKDIKYKNNMFLIDKNTVNDMIENYGAPKFADNVQVTNPPKCFGLKVFNIQIIYANSKENDEKLAGDASLLIQNCFDFPVLENWYDGKEITVSFPDMVQKRVSTIRKRIPINKCSYDRNLAARILKYQDYGLKIITVPYSEYIENDENDENSVDNSYINTGLI